MYQNSIFALTYRKTGWDCFRHYEILMNGCIPFFLEIDKCPNKTLEKLPKDLLKKTLKKYEWVLSYYNPFLIYKYKFLDMKKIMLFLISSIKSRKSLESFIDNNEEVFEIKEKLSINLMYNFVYTYSPILFYVTFNLVYILSHL